MLSTSARRRSGLAPVEVRSIKVNGNAYPLSWTSTAAWRLTLPVSATSTTLNLQAHDYYDRPIACAAGTVTVHYTGPLPDPAPSLVINKNMFNPLVPDAEYIELHNKGAGAVNLAGWQFTDGVQFIFPDVTLPGGGYLVVAEDMATLHQQISRRHQRGGQLGGIP